MDRGIVERLLGLRELRPRGFHAGLRRLHAPRSLARAVERGLVLLARRVGLGFGGFLLGAGLFVGAPRNVAGGHQVLIAFGIGGGQPGLRLRRLVIGSRGRHFRHVPGRTAPPVHPDARIPLAAWAEVAWSSCARAWSSLSCASR